MSEIGNRTAVVELNREWLVARVVFVVGFVIAIAFAIFWSLTHKPELAGADEGTAPVADSSSPTSEGMMACRASIIIAENFGVVPNTLKFAGGPNKTDTVGRYTCLADDSGGTRYSVTFDLICRQLNDARCVSLYTATKADGTMLYQRQGGQAAPVETPAPDTSSTDGSADATPASPPDGSSSATDGSGDAAPSDSSSAPQQQP